MLGAPYNPRQARGKASIVTPMTDWNALAARAGRAGHDLVGWLMWDPGAIAEYAALGVPNGAGWLVAWRLAPLGDTPAPVAAAATYSINPAVVAGLMSLYRATTTPSAIAAARDVAVERGLDDVAPGLGAALAPLSAHLWRGVDSVHHGARPMFAAHRAEPRPEPVASALSAWRAANCLRELRGDNHWALCAAADLDDVEVGLLHSVMVDPDEYGSEEWIARSRGNDDEAIERGWSRLRDKGLATGASVNDQGRRFRLDLERRTDELTAPAWRAVGLEATLAFCEAIEPHHRAIVARIDATAGPRWMPAVRSRPDLH